MHGRVVLAAALVASWPVHNFNLANTRADFATRIDARNVATLKKAWSFDLPYNGPYGAFTSNPIVVGDVVYVEDPDSEVFALALTTGKLLWKHDYRSVTPSGGPNGVAYGGGLLYGVTADSVFALDPRTGRQAWLRKLVTDQQDGIDMAPQFVGGKLLVSTIPGTATSFYTAGAKGVVYALDAHSGSVLWRFSTVKGEKVSGGGLWYPPAVDSHGRVYLGIGNPAPYPPSASDPNARGRPGNTLYTNSLVALDEKAGKLLWYRQVTAHDLRDYDFQDSPILVTVKVHGVATEAVIGAGKSGYVVAFRASDGKRLWTLAVGKHNRWQSGPLPSKPIVYCPGSLGGVLTPMAEARGVVYVPWIDLCFKASSTGLVHGGPVPPVGGGLAAVDAATGKVRWKHAFTNLDAGAATVANDVVFTSTYGGVVWAFSADTGRVLWHTRTPAGINSFPALSSTMLVLGTGAPTAAGAAAQGQIIAFRLGSAGSRR